MCDQDYGQRHIDLTGRARGFAIISIQDPSLRGVSKVPRLRALDANGQSAPCFATEVEKCWCGKHSGPTGSRAQSRGRQEPREEAWMACATIMDAVESSLARPAHATGRLRRVSVEPPDCESRARGRRGEAMDALDDDAGLAGGGRVP